MPRSARVIARRLVPVGLVAVFACLLGAGTWWVSTIQVAATSSRAAVVAEESRPAPTLSSRTQTTAPAATPSAITAPVPDAAPPADEVVSDEVGDGDAEEVERSSEVPASTEVLVSDARIAELQNAIDLADQRFREVVNRQGLVGQRIQELAVAGADPAEIDAAWVEYNALDVERFQAIDALVDAQSELHWATFVPPR